MEEFKFDITGCSSDAIVKSTLATLHVFHDEIISLRKLLLECEKDQAILKQEIDNKNLIISSKEMEVSELEKQNRLSANEINRLNSQLEELSKSHQEELKNVLGNHEKSIREIEAKQAVAINEINDSHSTELHDSTILFEKRINDLEKSLDSLSKDKIELDEECKMLSKGLLSIFGKFAKEISTELNELLGIIDNEALRNWIIGILDKGEGSELKGLDAFNEIKSLELLKRNVVFQNSLFSEIATLLLWASNEELKIKLAPSFEWDKLSSIFKEFMSLLTLIGIPVSIPNNMQDIDWFSKASNIADQTEQKRFIEFFGKDFSLERGAPIFITSISASDNNGSYIRYYK